jgi:site-specific DNA-cytosine methylase
MIPNIPMDSPSQTITGGGSDAGGAEPVRHRLRNADGPGPHSGVVLRRLTVAECAVIQDFPPGFEFTGTQTSQYRQIGNAVPGGLAAALGGAISAKLASY